MNIQQIITLVVIVLAIGISLNFMFTWIGKSRQYWDGITATKMAACQDAGYTYGECFNTIEARERIKFSH